ncbi:hypothetical protein R3P38DRAFT_3170857 [Favolaschia claudopus]|uniref:Uncharacterized protein n=1 Tax=Favolaschia claudopus TaxID=2862362 RepID=A0AAW0DS09_9AGAR
MPPPASHARIFPYLRISLTGLVVPVFYVVIISEWNSNSGADESGMCLVPDLLYFFFFFTPLSDVEDSDDEGGAGLQLLLN